MDNDLSNIKNNLKDKGYAVVNDFFDKSLLLNTQSKYQEIFKLNKISKNKLFGLSVKKKLVKYLNFPLVISADAVSLVLNKKVIEIAKDYLQSEIILSYVVAYRTEATSKALRYYYNTPGVFSGWHSDNQLSVHKHRMLTTMIYLSDVDQNKGPLELAEKTFDLNLNKRIFMEEELENYNKKTINGNLGTTIFFDMDGVHKANVPIRGYRDVLRFSFSPKGGYKEKIYFNFDGAQHFDNTSKTIINFNENKRNYKEFKYAKQKKNLKEIIYMIKEIFVFYLCHFELFSKWYLKRRIKILNMK